MFSFRDNDLLLTIVLSNFVFFVFVFASNKMLCHWRRQLKSHRRLCKLQHIRNRN